MRIKPKNWESFQQYKDRKPTWIKFHRDLLNDYSYSTVQIGTKATLPLLWLLASEYDDGVINATIEEISFRIHIDKNTVTKAIAELIEKGFFLSDDEDVQSCTEEYKMLPREEKRREEKEYILEKDFSLTKLTSYDNVSDKYKEKLEEFLTKYIDDLELKIMKVNSKKKTLQYDDFILALSAKGYKYKNFISAYKTWNRKA